MSVRFFSESANVFHRTVLEMNDHLSLGFAAHQKLLFLAEDTDRLYERKWNGLHPHFFGIKIVLDDQKMQVGVGLALLYAEKHPCRGDYRFNGVIVDRLPKRDIP